MIARLINAVDSAGGIRGSKDPSYTTEFALDYSYLKRRDSGPAYGMPTPTSLC
jgi:hypothetical protein